MAAAKVTIRKYMGDDAYSWAVFLTGRVVMSGLSKSEAVHYQKQVRTMKGVH